VNGSLYVADIDTIRWFDMSSGEPRGAVPVDGATSFNDIEVAEDGTIYATQTGTMDGTVPQRVYRIGADGRQSIFLEGDAINRPNGIAFDPDGNIVIVNIGDDSVLTFSSDGELLRTEHSADPGSDGLVILPDGTKYVSSVRQGTISRIVVGKPAERIASGIPSAASICHDPSRNRLIVPMNNGNAIAFVDLS
jgi:sugar lactone lactonase YvrE